jgi:hypothetical protein
VNRETREALLSFIAEVPPFAKWWNEEFSLVLTHIIPLVLNFGGGFGELLEGGSAYAHFVAVPVID